MEVVHIVHYSKSISLYQSAPSNTSMDETCWCTQLLSYCVFILVSWREKEETCKEYLWISWKFTMWKTGKRL